MLWEAVIEQNWRRTWRGSMDGAPGAETLFIRNLGIVGMKRIEYNMVWREKRDWLGAGDSRCWDDAVCGVCSTQCMLYLLFTLDHGMER
jgi:hypothetical protein